MAILSGNRSNSLNTPKNQSVGSVNFSGYKRVAPEGKGSERGTV